MVFVSDGIPFMEDLSDKCYISFLVDIGGRFIGGGGWQRW